MRVHRTRFVVALMVAIALCLSPRLMAADLLTYVRQLYAAAAYEQALAALDNATSSATLDDARAVLEYRALCLLALDRPADAARVAEAIVRMHPLSEPVPADMSPRLATLIQQARVRLAPDIVRERYARAHDAFEKQAFQTAADDFASVVAMFNDDALKLGSEGGLADMRALAEGFLELARKQIPPPPTPASNVRASNAPAATAPPADADASAPVVTPPVAIDRRIPPMPPRVRDMVPQSHEGELELSIGADGRVTDAKILVPLDPAYDRDLLFATRSWRYRPATRDGVPVSSTTTVKVKLGD